MNKKILFITALFLIPFTSALTSGEATIAFGAIFSLAVIVIFFLAVSIIITNPPMKVFFMSLSLLTILASVGMGVSIMQESFSDLTNIVDAYGSFYILLVTLMAAGFFALLLWLIITAVKSFYSYKDDIDDLDEDF